MMSRFVPLWVVTFVFACIVTVASGNTGARDLLLATVTMPAIWMCALTACRAWDDAAATVGERESERSIFHRFLLTYSRYAQFQ